MTGRIRSRMTETDRRTETIVRPTTGDGDHDRFAHYVQKDDIMRSAVDGVAVMALCGKIWIPNRDPERYPVCPTCKEIMGEIRSFGSDGGSGDDEGGA